MVERLLLVGVGAGVGGVVRYLVHVWADQRFGGVYPIGTLLVNATGSLLLAFIVVLTADRLGLGPEVRLLLGTGFCGGYTTFSTFAYDTVLLAESGAWVAVLLYTLASLALSVGGAVAGVWLARLL